MKPEKNLGMLANAWVEVLEFPKKLNESFDWISEHPILASVTVAATLGIGWLFRRRKIYFVAQSGRSWSHRSLNGQVIGEYASRKKAVAAANAYHAMNRRALVYVMDSQGRVAEVLKF
jgi:hypothetical protein